MIEKKEFEAVFRHHYDGMFRLASRLLADDAESKDVVSEVFATLLDGHVDLHSPTLQGFLLTCVRNRCINVLTRKRKAAEANGLLALNANDEDEGEREQLSAIRQYIQEHLPDLSQQILRLRYQQGMKYREIAAALDVSEVTVHNHLSQSLKQLKDHFKSLGYGIV